MIKLYKVNYGKEYNETKIEYIEDIIFDEKNFKGFNKPISCIAQSTNDGKILISCWDGNVYLFNIPKIDFYLEYDKKIKENISFNEFFKENIFNK